MRKCLRGALPNMPSYIWQKHLLRTIFEEKDMAEKIKEPESHELHYRCEKGDFHHSFKASFLQHVQSAPAKHMGNV